MTATVAPPPPPKKRAAPRRRRKKRWFTPKDAIFFAFAVATYVHEFFQGDEEPTLLGLFAVFFFLGLIPALKADNGGLTLSDVTSILIRMLGGEPSRSEDEEK